MCSLYCRNICAVIGIHSAITKGPAPDEFSPVAILDRDRTLRLRCTNTNTFISGTNPYVVGTYS